MPRTTRVILRVVGTGPAQAWSRVTELEVAACPFGNPEWDGGTGAISRSTTLDKWA